MTFDRIADFTLGRPQIPERALRMGATLLLDTLGVAAGASGMTAGRIARDHAVRFHGAPNPADAATLLFDGRRASLSGAAFATATQIDNLDAHDGYNPTKGHIGCAVVPALCAVAEHLPDLTARAALEALVISYEVAARAGIALHATVPDYHTSGAWNALGVAALACRLRGRDADTLRHALGIAEYHGPRSQMMREIANPTMLHDGSGMGALVGTMATLMAENGFQGAPAVTVENAPAHWSDLGQLWTIERNYIKPYPICRWAHAAIDALGHVMTDHNILSADIAQVDVRTFSEAAALYPGMPHTTSEAQYSLPFALATRLVHGEIGPEHIQGDGLRDPAVAKALAKIVVHEEPRHSKRFPLARWSDVTVRLTNGQALRSGDIHATGGPEAPMSDAAFKAKFYRMTQRLGAHRQARLWRMKSALLDPQTLFSDLLELLHDPVEAPDA
jgi:2-methylcitrate dehydratase PrpD